MIKYASTYYSIVMIINLKKEKFLVLFKANRR